MEKTQFKPANQEFFLPDLCHAQSVFMVLLISELLAVIFTLLNLSPQISLWNLLGLYSISVQTISLVWVAVLCLLRSWLAKYPDWICGLLSLTSILIITLGFSLCVIRYYWLYPLDLSQPLQYHLVLRNLLIAGLIGSVVLRYFYLQQQYRRQLDAEASARLQALQARIRPHFLFNSMNVIASLTRIDPLKAEAAIEDLSDLFRTTLEAKQELIPFREELQNSEKYLAIEKLRLADRLDVFKQVETDAEEILIPPLSVQPLLENAVYHGIQMLPQGGTVNIVAKIKNDFLVITIINPKAEQKNSRGHGIALKNISQRLEVIYGGEASLTRKSDADTYQVEMIIPVERKANGLNA